MAKKGIKPIKDKGGRPPKYKTELEMALKISDYFGKCDEKRELPNKAGLCLFLGITRESYGDYKERFPDTIKGADSTIENAWVQRLGGNSPTGAIFYLKNAFKEHYKDKHETDLTSKGEKVQFGWVAPKEDD